MSNYNEEICKLVYENLENFNVTKLNFMDCVIGITKALKCRKLYRKNGLVKSLDFIKDSARFDMPTDYNKDNIIFQIRKAMVIHNNVCKVLKKSQKCLENSVSLCCFLAYIGFKTELVIGKTTNYTNPEFNFHAWVEFECVPINDTRSVLEMYNKIYIKNF